MNLKQLHVAARLSFLAASCVTWSGESFAQAIASNDQAQEILLLKQQLEALSKNLDALAVKQAQPASNQQVTTPTVASKSATPSAQQASDANVSSDWGAGMPPKLKSLLAALGDMDFYGNLDLSVDDATKGLKSAYVLPNGTVVSPKGQMGWQPDASSNL